MERTVALKKLRRLLGDRLGYRVDPKAPDKEARAAARVEAERMTAEYKDVAAARDARRAALLAADDEYQRLHAAAACLHEARDRTRGVAHHYRFTVGLVSELFFSVKAQGDSWEDVISQLEAKR